MGSMGSSMARSIGAGILGVGLAYLLGFMLTAFQNPVVLAAVFVIAMTWSSQLGREHPARMLPAAILGAIVVIAIVIFLISPTYIER
jgi:choline-glycine betaine transporter